jgi:lipopolysaccharide transport system permease protein
MTAYVTSIWRCRHFWFSLVKMDLRTRYRRSMLGIGWSLLNPIAMTTVLCTVYCNLFGMNLKELGPQILGGLAFWGFVSASALQGAQSLYQGEAYIRQYPAPMAIYPLRVVLGAGFHLLIALSVVIGLTWALRGFDNLAMLPSVVPVLFLLLVFGWSLATLTGLANVYFPDTFHMLEVGLQILFYATPIIIPEDLLRQRGLGWMADYNPLAALLETVRRPLISGEAPPMTSYLVACVTVLVMFSVATFALHRLQRRVIFHM